MKTYRLEDGKYEIDRDDQTGLMLAARRNGEPWSEGFALWRTSKFIHAMLNQIDALAADARRMRFLLDGNGYFMEENILCGHHSDEHDKEEARRYIDGEIQLRGWQG